MYLNLIFNFSLIFINYTKLKLVLTFFTTITYRTKHYFVNKLLEVSLLKKNFWPEGSINYI